MSMMLQMTVINAPMDDTVRNNTILLLVSLVTQVNTCQVMSPAIMRANQIVKYVSTVDIAMEDMRLAAGVMRENSSMIMQQQELSMIIRMIVGYALRENTENEKFKIHAKAVLLEHIIAMVPLTQYITIPIQIVRCVKVENILLRQQLQVVVATVHKVLHVRAHMMVIHGMARTIT